MSIGKVTTKSQVTIPKEIAKEINLKAGDHIVFEVMNGGIFIKPVVMVPKDQSWFFTKEWQKAEREADEDLKTGRYTEAKTVDEALAHLDSLKGGE